MKKSFCFSALLLSLFINLNAITVTETIEVPSLTPKKITSFCYSQNFGTELTKSATNISYSGSGKLDVQDYFLDFNIGISNQIQYGGLYGKTIFNHDAGTVNNISMTDMNGSQFFNYSSGVAFDIPLQSYLNLNIVAGPSFSFAFIFDKNDQANGNFLFGVFGSVAARFFPDKEYNLICGADLGYDFLNASLDTNTNQSSLGCNYISLKTFVGVSIVSESWITRFRHTFRK